MGLSRSESRCMVNNLLQDLRILNQEGIDLYKNHFSNETIWENNQSGYEEMFEERLRQAEELCAHNCQ